MATARTYDRYGLTSNPFRDLSSENLENVELFHVNLTVDESIRTIKDEVLEKQNRAVVALVGGRGSGKTERLLLAQAEALEHHAFAVYVNLSETVPWILQQLAAEFTRAAKKSGRVRLFSSPPWYRPVAALARARPGRYDPIKAGRTIARALNESAPSFLLLNDLHNIGKSSEVDPFVRLLQELADSIQPGVLVMFGCYPSYLDSLLRYRPGFPSRINRTFALPALNDGEAALLLAKKLLAKRVVDDLDPLFPFDREAVAMLNEAVGGAPRQLLRIADLTLEYAIAHRSYRIDPDIASAVLAARKSSAETGRPVNASSAAPSTVVLPTATLLAPPTLGNDLG